MRSNRDRGLGIGAGDWGLGIGTGDGQRRPETKEGAVGRKRKATDAAGDTDAPRVATRARGAKKPAREPARRHSVYVVFLRNPKGDGKAGYYVGMTGLTPEARLANHLAGIKA